MRGDGKRLAFVHFPLKLDRDCLSLLSGISLLVAKGFADVVRFDITFWMAFFHLSIQLSLVWGSDMERKENRDWKGLKGSLGMLLELYFLFVPQEWEFGYDL